MHYDYCQFRSNWQLMYKIMLALGFYSSLFKMNASFHLFDIFIVSYAHVLYSINISIEGGPRYKPPGVSRWSPAALQCLLLISVSL